MIFLTKLRDFLEHVDPDPYSKFGSSNLASTDSMRIRLRSGSKTLISPKNKDTMGKRAVISCLDDVLAGKVEDLEGLADAEEGEVCGVDVLEQAAQVPGLCIQQDHLPTRLLKLLKYFNLKFFKFLERVAAT